MFISPLSIVINVHPAHSTDTLSFKSIGELTVGEGGGDGVIPTHTRALE